MKILYSITHSKFKFSFFNSFCKPAVYTLFFIIIHISAFGQWTRKADELRQRAEGINAVYQNKLYVFGGFYNNPVIEKTNEVYDIATDKWSKIASFPVGKEITHQGLVLVDDNIWLIGGRAIDAHGPASSQVIIYNITTNTWSNGPELIDPATGIPFPMGAGGYVLVGRTIHVFGGFGPTLCDDQATLHLTIDVDQYNANRATTTWENKLAPMPIPRNHISYVVLGGKIYALGGQFKHDCGAADQKYCHVYDPATNIWTRLTDLPIQRSHAEGSTFAVDGKIFLVAGQGVNNATQNTVYQFTPQSNNGLGAWTNLTAYKLPGSFLGLSAKLAANKFIITNGALNQYNNERKETYIATVARSSARTLGFGSACISQNAGDGTNIKARNLLYSIEDTAPYTLTSDANWLTVSRNGVGVATLNGIDVEVNINTVGLAPGSYKGTITARAAATASTASFCVNLNVTSSSGYGLTVTPVGNGKILKNPDQPVYPVNSVVALNAVPDSGWKFNGWTGDLVTTSNPIDVTMDRNLAITATFIEDVKPPIDPPVDPPTPPVSLVSNISTATGRVYRLTTLTTTKAFYTDRAYPITSVPASLVNASLIQTPNDDKKNATSSVFSFNLSRPATVYIAYDPRATVLPAWLQGWQKLTDIIGLQDPLISYFSLYSKTFPAGKVTLGGNMASPAKGTQGNYFVIAKDITAPGAAPRIAAGENNPNPLVALENPKKVVLENIIGTADIKPVIYPNPVQESFRIVFPENYKGLQEIRIVDTKGNTFKLRKPDLRSSGNVTDVNIGQFSLKPGLYSVAVISVDGKKDVIRIMAGQKDN
ncbi:InlB B-repeat-containing protein [Dyadobacter sp. NIV53]|uniref:Kelch repeat-containing protein n=1 Tax=Dyadobacter sp. NIV53 TaxID=2861765 RepID=UPI001C86CB09|nr:kelch repeat-containing protein [Dyadobacter sp. NIV53]